MAEAYLTFPTQEDIAEYAERTLPVNFPFTKKVMKAYIESLFSSKEINEAYKLISAAYSHSSANVLLKSFSNRLVKFNDEPHLRVWAYSLKAKDLELFALISEMTGWPYLLRYGMGLVVEPVAALDWAGSPKLDEGYSLDMDTNASIPIIVFQANYCLDTKYFPGMKNFLEINSVIEKESEFISLVKPARVLCILCGYPYLAIRRSGDSPIPVSMGFALEQSPFDNDSDVDIIDGLSGQEFQKYYNAFEFGIHPTTVTPIKNSDKIKEFRIERNSKITTQIILRSSHPLLSDFVFALDWSRLLWPVDTAFCVFQLTIDFNVPDNITYTVLNGAAAGTPDTDYTIDYDGGEAGTPDTDYTAEYDGENVRSGNFRRIGG